MKRQGWLILLGAWSVACGSKVDVETRDNCDAYLDCLAETDVDTFEDEIGVYGSNGSCFDNASNEDCQTACLQKLDALGEDDEACEPPPEPMDSPTGDVPEPGSVVDCADYSDGPTVGPGEPGPLGFPEVSCNPRADGGGEYRCCSDDPAAVDGGLPVYGGGAGASPYFADVNNGLGTSGMCVRTDDIPSGAGLQAPAAFNCPLPCNPTWDDADIGTVCGIDRVCCQTRELQPEDCIRDEDGTWRPVTGADIVGGATRWATGEHATHQDPGGQGCSTLSGSSDPSDPAFLACIEQLTVADQRGFCMALQPGQGCPGDTDDYLDACEQINAGLIPPPV